MPALSENLFERQLHFVCGKGGVGKSTFSCALARHFTNIGLRTLLVQVNAEDSHSHLLESKAIGPEILKISPLLWAVNVAPEPSLREYLLLKLRSERLYRLVFNNPLMRSFLKFTPALAELNMLGKIWHHAEQTQSGAHCYERIVVDCPAMGHGYRFLSVARVTYEGVRHGKIADEALAIAKTLADKKRSCLHIVTLPEELPVNETLELTGLAESSGVMPLGFIVINALIERLFDEAAVKLFQKLCSEKPRHEFHELINCSANRIAAEAYQQIHIDKLQGLLKHLPKMVLPFGAIDGKALDIEKLAKIIAEYQFGKVTFPR